MHAHACTCTYIHTVRLSAGAAPCGRCRGRRHVCASPWAGGDAARPARDTISRGAGEQDAHPHPHCLPTPLTAQPQPQPTPNRSPSPPTQVNKMLIDDKGTLLLCVFGLPPRPHADDAQRAVRTLPSPTATRSTPAVLLTLALTARRSPLTAHRSPLTARRSPLTARRSPLAAHRSPLTAHRSPSPMKVRAALALRDAMDGSASSNGVKACIGVATGRAFCGIVGSGKRREYTTMVRESDRQPRPLCICDPSANPASLLPRVAGRSLVRAGALLPTCHLPLATCHFPLPTSYLPLPTSHFLLATSYLPLPTLYLESRSGRATWSTYRHG